MLKKIKEMSRITANMKSQSVSMRRKLTLYWLCMALAVLAVLLLILNFIGVFSISAKKLNESLMIQEQNAVNSVKDHIDSLEAGCLTLSKSVETELTNFLVSKNIPFDALNNNPDAIVQLEEKLYTPLNTLLQSSKCSGAFIVLDATCNTQAPDAEHSRMGLYLRYSDLSSVNASNKHIVYFRGASEVARNEKIQMHNRWNLEFDTEIFPGYSDMISQPVKRLADHCYWSERLNLLDTWEDAVLLCLPISGPDGAVRGICGIELSALYFRLSYPPASGSFGNMLMALAPIEGNEIFMDHAMIGNSDDANLQHTGSLIVDQGRLYNTYTNGSDVYYGMHHMMPIRLSSGRNLALITLVSEKNYQNAVFMEKIIWISGLLIFFAVMMVLSRALAGYFTTPIEKALDDIRQDITPQERHSGISEIDELVEYLYNKKQNTSDKELPPNIEELFETFKKRVESLTPMERTVLQYYIDGYSLEEVAEKAYISINTAKKHNTNINRKLGITRREELMLYIDLFRRCGRIDEITYNN